MKIKSNLFKISFFLIFISFFSQLFFLNFNNKNNFKTIRDNNDILEIELGINHSASITNNGDGTQTLFMWGSNGFGQLGDGTSDNKNIPTPIDIDGDGLIGNEKILDVDLGFYSSSALLDNTDGTQTLYTWGDNINGQLGTGDSESNISPTPIDIDGDGTPGNEKIIELIFTKNNAAVLIDTDNNISNGGEEIWVWGNNQYGTISNDNFINKIYYSPKKLEQNESIIKKVKNVYFSSMNSFLLLNNDDGTNTLLGRGQNQYGQLGFNKDGQIHNLQAIDVDGDGISGNEKILSADIGYYGSVSALLNNNNEETNNTQTLYTWGNYYYNELGDGTKQHRHEPTPIDIDGDGISGNEKILSFNKGYVNSSVILENDQNKKIFYIWGDNNFGQIGDGTTIDKPKPTLIDIDGDGEIGDEKILNIKLGYLNSSIILEDENNQKMIYLWGHNQFGQIGDGTNDNKYVPTPIEIKILFDFSIINKNQKSFSFKIINTNLKLSNEEKNNLSVFDTKNNEYMTTYNDILELFTINNLSQGKKYHFEYVSLDNGIKKYNINNFSYLLTDYEIEGINSWSTTSTTAEIHLNIISSNFSEFSEEERTIQIEYNFTNVENLNYKNYFEATIDKNGVLNLNNLSEGTKYEITKINYNKQNDASFKYSVEIDNNNEISTLFNGLYFVDINNTFEIIDSSIKSNSFKFTIQVFDNEKIFNNYKFIYLFFKNTKGGDSPILAYKTNPEKNGSDFYEFEVKNLSSNTKYEFVGISIDRIMSEDDTGSSEKFENSKFLSTKENTKKSYGYLIFILFLLIILIILFIYFIYQGNKSHKKNISEKIDELNSN